MRKSEMNKSEVVSKLLADVIDVTFTKVDGSSRMMRATLDTNRIQYDNPSDVVRVQKSLESVQAVWDVDASAWRSFRWSSVTEVDGVKTSGVDLGVPS
tara:strand:+ start:205 stop:498 length:294 start_codon:yes stop_codon:yes gene_type:complete